MRACSVSEQDSHIPLDRRMFLRWLSRWWRGQHESGSPSFSITRRGITTAQGGKLALCGSHLGEGAPSGHGEAPLTTEAPVTIRPLMLTRAQRVSSL